jgi:hypothetical protein
MRYLRYPQCFGEPRPGPGRGRHAVLAAGGIAIVAAVVAVVASFIHGVPAAVAQDFGPPPVRLEGDRPLGLGMNVFGPALSPDGKHALFLKPQRVFGGDTGFTVLLAATADGKEIARTQAVAGAELDDLALALLSSPWSPDGKRFVAYGAANVLALFTLTGTAELAREDLDRGDVRGAAFARDGTLVWMRYRSDEKRAELVVKELSTGKTDVVARVPGQRPIGLFLSPAGRLAAIFRPAARGTAEMAVVDLARGDVVRAHPLPPTELGIESAIARFSPDGRWIYVSEGGALMAVATAPGTPARKLIADGVAPLALEVKGYGEVVLFYGEHGLAALGASGGTPALLGEGEAVLFSVSGDLVGYYSDVKGGGRLARLVHLAPPPGGGGGSGGGAGSGGKDPPGSKGK